MAKTKKVTEAEKFTDAQKGRLVKAGFAYEPGGAWHLYTKRRVYLVYARWEGETDDEPLPFGGIIRDAEGDEDNLCCMQFEDSEQAIVWAEEVADLL